jgi:hypothetical protein
MDLDGKPDDFFSKDSLFEHEELRDALWPSVFSVVKVSEVQTASVIAVRATRVPRRPMSPTRGKRKRREWPKGFARSLLLQMR